MERKLKFWIGVYPPKSARLNKNVTLHFKVEKISMRGLARGSEDYGYLPVRGLGYLPSDQTTAYLNITPANNANFALYRKVSCLDVNHQRLDVMPGFRLTWWYTGAEVTPDNKYKDEEMTKQFVR